MENIIRNTQANVMAAALTARCKAARLVSRTLPFGYLELKSSAPFRHFLHSDGSEMR